MVRGAHFDSNGVKRGAWSIEEDNLLRSHIEQFGHPNWRLLPLHAGLKRLGKSCRLRWMNYLKPGLKRGKITKHEQDLIIKLHNQFGNNGGVIAKIDPSPLEFFDFGMSELISDSSSDDGMISWNSSSAELIQGVQPVEEDTFDVLLW